MINRQEAALIINVRFPAFVFDIAVSCFLLDIRSFQALRRQKRWKYSLEGKSTENTLTGQLLCDNLNLRRD